MTQMDIKLSHLMDIYILRDDMIMDSNYSQY